MIQAPRGTKDIYAHEAYLWHEIEKIIRKIFYEFNFDEIRTPMFEKTELFIRSVGESSDIIQKEVYSFLDKSNRSLTLKPEGTAGVVRSAIEHNLFMSNKKLFYFTPAFRYERPQDGRYREFLQCGAELFGIENYFADCEIISLAYRILEELGLKNILLKINSIGCENCRLKYNLALKDFIRNNINNLCAECKKRYEINILRVLDCKDLNCKKILDNSPNILEFICEECKLHFDNLLASLESLKINFEINNKIVRGLDYYTRTVFEFVNNDLAICGGGRYDNLVKELGGMKTPAVGFAFGFERLVKVLREQNLFMNLKRKIDLFICALGLESLKFINKLCYDLRRNNFKIEKNYFEKNIKSQIKLAESLNAKFFVVIGDNELENKKIKIKKLDTREEIELELSLNDMIKFLYKNI